MRSRCIECFSMDTELFRGEDGHFRKECHECGYISDPFISAKTMREEKDIEESKEEESEDEEKGIFDF